MLNLKNNIHTFRKKHFNILIELVSSRSQTLCISFQINLGALSQRQQFFKERLTHWNKKMILCIDFYDNDLR